MEQKRDKADNTIQVERFCNLIKYFSKNNPSNILEVGARDCTETVLFQKFFPKTKIYSFECNPETLPICRKNILGIKNIELIESAASDTDGEVTFFQIDTKKTKTVWKDGNPGASSLFVANDEYPEEKYAQLKITVPSKRISTLITDKSIKEINGLWMDAQGAELLVLKGAGDSIGKISLIQTEVEFFEIYKGQPLFSEIKNFLNKNNFLLLKLYNLNRYSADAIFVNKTQFNKAEIVYYTLRDRLIVVFLNIKSVLSKIKKYLLKEGGIYSFDYFPKKPGFFGKILSYYNLLRIRMLKKLFIIKNNEIQKRIEKEKELVIQIPYGGLGDHLSYSSIPKLLWEQKRIKTLISNKSIYTNKDIRDFVWSRNPYIKFTNKKGWFNTSGDPKPYKTYDELFLNIFGLEGQGRPEIFYSPKKIQGVEDCVVLDVSYGLSGKLNGYNKTEFTDNLCLFISKNIPNFILLVYKNRPLNESQAKIIEKFTPKTLEISGLENLTDIFYSAKKVYALYSGTNSLLAAINKSANILCAKKANPFFQYKINNYIDIL